MIEGKPGPEPKINITELYHQPHILDKEIRKLKKEISNHPGIEGREELLEKYAYLKEKREDAREMILENLEKVNSSKEEILANAEESMKNAEIDFETAITTKNETLKEQARERWQIASDFYNLLSRDEEYWKNITIEEEDDGSLELGELEVKS